MKPGRFSHAGHAVRRAQATVVVLARMGLLLLGAFIVIDNEAVHAQSGDGPTGEVPASECCLTLLVPVGARALALGNAMASRGGTDALFVNPAGLGRVVDDEFVVYNANSTLSKSNTFSLVIHSRVAGTFAVGYRLIDYGDISATDPLGNPTGTVSNIDQTLWAGYGAELAGGLSAGVTYKLYQFREDCHGFCQGESGFAATTHAIDAGLQYHPARHPELELGIAVTNLGFALQVVNERQASPVPTRLRAGASYEIMHHFQRADSALSLRVGVNLSNGFRPAGGAVVASGLEFSVADALLLWVGHTTGTGLVSGFSVGFGIAYERFDVAVAKAFASSSLEDSDPFQITFGVRF